MRLLYKFLDDLVFKVQISYRQLAGFYPASHRALDEGFNIALQRCSRQLYERVGI